MFTVLPGPQDNQKYPHPTDMCSGVEPPGVQNPREECSLPQSVDGSRRQGKIHKLKIHSALHHTLKGGVGRCQVMSTGQGEATPDNRNMSELGAAIRKAGETQEPSGKDRSCNLQPSQSDQLGQFPLVRAATIAQAG